MSKINIELNKLATDLEGKDIEGINLAKTLSGLLANVSQGDAVKYFGWALDLYSLKPLSLDDSDFSNLKGFVESSSQLSNAIKAQILFVLRDAKEASKEKKGE